MDACGYEELSHVEYNQFHASAVSSGLAIAQHIRGQKYSSHHYIFQESVCMPCQITLR